MKRYYLCHFSEQKALQYDVVPDIWGSITGGLSHQDDEVLADLSWAGYPDHGFLTEEAARERGIAEESMQAARSLAGELELVVVRTQRDALLSASDVFVLPDRWAGYTKAQRQAWTDYRAALRDLPSTVTDPFNVTWPQAPGAQ